MSHTDCIHDAASRARRARCSGVNFFGFVATPSPFLVVVQDITIGAECAETRLRALVVWLYASTVGCAIRQIKEIQA